ncbi:hypothetical protein ACFC26_30990 [Kitasatospora purpeofusca]|uniref:hypothetical protein n=1 Tax=Kitasatospora purpeofusca TaxID=67352 RepID=UPI0035D77A1D
MNPTFLSTDEAATRQAELQVRAQQIKPLSWPQYRTLRSGLVAAGVSEEVAATMPLILADPQDVLAQLKNLRPAILASGVVARAISTDVLVAGLILAPENLRMDEKRNRGSFTMPRYIDDSEPAGEPGLPDRSACLLDLSDHAEADVATQFLFDQMKEIDSEITEVNKYGEDIAASGIRIGGLLFPFKIRIPGRPDIGGLETGDCYGRVYFTQTAEGISVKTVLKHLAQVPTTAVELRTHPLQKHRADLRAIAGKLTSPTPAPITVREQEKLVRATMPATKIVLSVEGVTLSEARRRAVAQQHIERPTPFTSDTEWQIRADAVLNHLRAQNELKTIPGISAETVISWMAPNSKKLLPSGIYLDDVAALAAASLLLTPGIAADRTIAVALRTRGVIGKERTRARPFVAAHVIARMGDRQKGRLSALERALNTASLRDMAVDVRPIEAIIDAARQELATVLKDRSKGKPVGMGPATQQVALRGTYYLICGNGDTVLLDRSKHGAAEGEGTEPATLLANLTKSRHGLEQLAQAIYDGRRGFPVRRLENGEQAADLKTPPTETEMMTSPQLRVIAFADDEFSDNSAASRLHADGQKLRKEVSKVTDRIDGMSGIKEPDAKATVIEQRGWRDPDGAIIGELETALKALSSWAMRHEILSQSIDGVDEETDGTDD